MSTPPRRFSVYYHVYVGLFIMGTALLPLFAADIFSEKTAIPVSVWALCCAWIALIAAVYFYSASRCSSDQLSYYEGLLFVAASMSAATPNFSFFFIIPSLLFVFLFAFVFALTGALTRKKDYARLRFHKLIAQFYKNRMRQ